MDIATLAKLVNPSNEETVDRKYSLSPMAIRRLEEAAKMCGLTMSKTLDLIILHATDSVGEEHVVQKDDEPTLWDGTTEDDLTGEDEPAVYPFDPFSD